MAEQFHRFRATSPNSRDQSRGSSDVSLSATVENDDGQAPALPLRSISQPGQKQPLLSNTNSQRSSAFSALSDSGSISLTSSHLPGQRTSQVAETQDPLGLNFIHGSSRSHADIIFVHGLGGSSIRTWSWERRRDVFWPAWIRHEEGLSQCRVFSYGYNANFKDSESPLSLLDFSKGLLAGMKTYGRGGEDGIGSVSYHKTYI